jgi:hypothetical protein
VYGVFNEYIPGVQMTIKRILNTPVAGGREFKTPGLRDLGVWYKRLFRL